MSPTSLISTSKHQDIKTTIKTSTHQRFHPMYINLLISCTSKHQNIKTSRHQPLSCTWTQWLSSTPPHINTPQHIDSPTQSSSSSHQHSSTSHQHNVIKSTQSSTQSSTHQHNVINSSTQCHQHYLSGSLQHSVLVWVIDDVFVEEFIDLFIRWSVFIYDIMLIVDVWWVDVLMSWCAEMMTLGW
jgi:hypothetical protein